MKQKTRYRFVALTIGLLTQAAYAQDSEEVTLDSLESEGSLDTLREELKKNPEAAAGTADAGTADGDADSKDSADSDDENYEEAPPKKVESPTLEWAKKDTETEDVKAINESDDYGDDGEFDSLEEEDTKSVDKNKSKEESAPKQIAPAKNPIDSSSEGGTDVAVFELGPEEQSLLELAQTIGQQIPDTQWSEITKNSNTTTYTVQKNDWLFKISKKLFGTGFYYPKIWSLNPYITNPHLIEPGMLLTFETGSGDGAPTFTITHDGTQSESEHPWSKEKEELEKQGIYINSSNEAEEKVSINQEYRKYEPMPLDTSSLVPPGQYDQFGIDKSSAYVTNFKQGYFLNTFITTNQIKDFGQVEYKINEGDYLQQKEIVYVKLNDEVTGNVGDQYSLYKYEGKVEAKDSDRSGERYTIVANLKLLRPMEDKWEAQITDITQVGNRSDRLTSYTPKIQKIYQTFNSKVVEAKIIQAFDIDMNIANIGAVVYLDRGRADGLEIGNVLDVFDNKDRSEGKSITAKHTYRTGQVNIISITDNFSTAIVSKIAHYFKIGDIAVTRSAKDDVEDNNPAKLSRKNPKNDLGTYDVDGLGPNVLSKVKSVKLTESELEELDRDVRKKRILDDTEKDLKDLDSLEQELATAEDTLNENELEEEEVDLETVEKKKKNDNFGKNLEELEQSYGKKYLDEDLNQADNPYGVTQFDVEEVDELLNLTDADFAGRDSESDSTSTGSSGVNKNTKIKGKK
jgi:nucleoid-associated protein YgaU